MYIYNVLLFGRRERHRSHNPVGLIFYHSKTGDAVSTVNRIAVYGDVKLKKNNIQNTRMRV